MTVDGAGTNGAYPDLSIKSAPEWSGINGPGFFYDLPNGPGFWDFLNFRWDFLTDFLEILTPKNQKHRRLRCLHQCLKNEAIHERGAHRHGWRQNGTDQRAAGA